MPASRAHCERELSGKRAGRLAQEPQEAVHHGTCMLLASRGTLCGERHGQCPGAARAEACGPWGVRDEGFPDHDLT